MTPKRCSLANMGRMPDFRFQELFELGEDSTPYRKLGGDFVRVVHAGGREILQVEREALVQLATAAFDDIAHLLRPGHLAQLRKILDAVPVGQLTTPELTRHGVEMYAICGKRESKADTPMKRKKREQVVSERFEKQSKAYLARLRREALIEHK